MPSYEDLISQPLFGFSDLFGDGKILNVNCGDDVPMPFACTDVTVLTTPHFPMQVMWLGGISGLPVWDIRKDAQGVIPYLCEIGAIRSLSMEEAFSNEEMNDELFMEAERMISTWHVIDEKGWVAIRLALK